jgi:hypothetical protein
MDELPQVRKLERKLVAGLICDPGGIYQVNGLEPKHFVDLDAKKAFQKISKF